MKKISLKNIVTIFMIFMIGIISGMLVFNSFSGNKIKADSGFDSSFDSGSDYSWDSGSDYSWGSSFGLSSDVSNEDFMFFFVIFIIIIIFFISIKAFTKNNILEDEFDRELLQDREIPNSEIKQYISKFDKVLFLEDRYNDFLDIQEAWMNFNYDILKSKLTDELYNQYKMQLDTLKIKNQKNIMENFEYVYSAITAITKENNILELKLELFVNFNDFLINEYNDVIRGNSYKKIKMHYELTFICNLDSKDVCPTCGANLKDSSLQTCEYCHNTITNIPKKWILSKKEALGQR